MSGEKVISHDDDDLHLASEEIKSAGQKRSIPEEMVTKDEIKSDGAGGGKPEAADLQPSNLITEKLMNVIENTRCVQTPSVGIEEVDTVKKTVTPLQLKKRRKTRGFITIEEFNRFAQQQPFKWLDLPQDCIYKLEKINVVDDKPTSGNFMNVDRIIIFVLLPQFVLDKLVALTETNVNIYIRSRGDEQVDIATMAKVVCKNCSKELSSQNYLRRHINICKARVERR